MRPTWWLGARAWPASGTGAWSAGICVRRPAPPARRATRWPSGSTYPSRSGWSTRPRSPPAGSRRGRAPAPRPGRVQQLMVLIAEVKTIQAVAARAPAAAQAHARRPRVPRRGPTPADDPPVRPRAGPVDRRRARPPDRDRHVRGRSRRLRHRPADRPHADHTAVAALQRPVHEGPARLPGRAAASVPGGPAVLAACGCPAPGRRAHRHRPSSPAAPVHRRASSPSQRVTGCLRRVGVERGRRPACPAHTGVRGR